MPRVRASASSAKTGYQIQQNARRQRASAGIQLAILKADRTFIKKTGGTLVYSTCTMDPTENEQVMHAFLEEHHEFEADPTLAERLPKLAPYVKDGSIQILPHYFGTDGFFICSMRKKGSQNGIETKQKEKIADRKTVHLFF